MSHDEMFSLYRDFVESSQDLFWQCDAEARCVYLSPAWEKLLGYRLDEILGRTFTDFQSTDAARRDLQTFSDIMAGKSFIDYESTFHTRDGKDVYLLLNCRAVLDANGAIVGTRGIAFDVTGRRSTETALRKSEELFSRVFQNTSVLLSITDLATGRYIDVNDEALRLSGYSREEVIGNTAAEIGWITEEQRGELVHIVQTTGRIDNLEMRFHRKDGSTLAGMMKGEIITIDGRDCLLTVTVDITERKAAEQEILAQEQRFRTMIMAISEGFYLSQILYDSSGFPCDYRYLEANGAFEKIVGLPREEIVGKRYSDLVPDDTTGWFANYCTVARTGESSTYEFYSQEYGAYFETYSYKTAPDQIAVFVIDVTSRKKIEARLQNVQKLEALGVLAGGIAHDFNNLIGGVFGNIDLALIEGRENERVTYFLSRAITAIDRARGLTRQLLTFAKGGEPAMQTGPLFPFIRETVQFALSGSKVTCIEKIATDLRHCSFDKNQLGQVIDNIVINAVQAMPDGGVIEVSAVNERFGSGEHPPLTGGSYVRISIKDSGIGMPREILQKIFDPFYSTKPKGHGLGLATCYSIVSRHKGCIDVESEPGHGSTFHVFLPAPDIDGMKKTSSTETIHRGSGTAIVMDDEEVVRESIGEMLLMLGYSVLDAGCGSEVFPLITAEQAAGHMITLMIFDLTVPGELGGREIVDEARRQSSGATIIVSSGYADNPVMSRPREFGFHASISKPFRMTELSALLEKLSKEERSV